MPRRSGLLEFARNCFTSNILVPIPKKLERIEICPIVGTRLGIGCNPELISTQRNVTNSKRHRDIMKPAVHHEGQRTAAALTGIFTAASYNIHQAIGTDRRHDRHRVVQVIKQLEADVIGLQEVDTNPNGDEMFQLDFFARHTGLKAIAGHTMRRRDSDYGNVLMTRHKILEVRNIDLSVPRREPRGAIDVDLEIDGVVVRVIVTHFGLSSRERFYQGDLLIKAVAHRRDAMVVVLSDLNEWHRYGRTSRSITPHFGRSARLRTFPSWMPLFALDRIWVWPENALISTRVHRQAPAALASDHLPITAKITTAACLRS